MLDFSTVLRNLGGSSQVEPKALARVVRASFVWESKAGFSIRQLTKTQMWFLIWFVLTSVPLFFFLTTATRWLAT